jgi:hypothetical protein
MHATIHTAPKAPEKISPLNPAIFNKTIEAEPETNPEVRFVFAPYSPFLGFETGLPRLNRPSAESHRIDTPHPTRAILNAGALIRFNRIKSETFAPCFIHRPHCRREIV